MLVLSRKELETLVIGESVLIKVNAINGNRVKIGIEAPDDISIRRGEIHFDRSEDLPCRSLSVDISGEPE